SLVSWLGFLVSQAPILTFQVSSNFLPNSPFTYRVQQRERFTALHASFAGTSLPRVFGVIIYCSLLISPTPSHFPLTLATSSLLSSRPPFTSDILMHKQTMSIPPTIWYRLNSSDREPDYINVTIPNVARLGIPPISPVVLERCALKLQICNRSFQALIDKYKIDDENPIIVQVPCLLEEEWSANRMVGDT
ncbi:hypothetical protein BC938DRAFT_479413, partial [Jimgerdemannia flammicorona]